MNRSFLMLLVLLVTILQFMHGPLEGQGRTDYLNIESPQVHPIEIARVDGHDYLLVVNTPDGSLEIWDTDESLDVEQRFLTRVRTGPEPVTVRYNSALESAYVANFLGDSVTKIALDAPTGPGSLDARVERTVWVGDEPLDLAFYDFEDASGQTQHTFFLTHMTLDSFGWYNANTLLAVAGLTYIDAVVNSGLDIDFDGEIDDIAIKEPHAIAVRCGQVFVLGAKGGNTDFYDFDLYASNITTAAARAIGGIGSTNLNMAFDSNDDLYVVGLEALNTVIRDEPNLAQAKTGFVKSMFYKIDNPCEADPVIHRRDVNLKPDVLGIPFGSTTQGLSQIATRPVDFEEALSMPTDLAIFERQGRPTKVFFTAFSSDRIGVIEPNSTTTPNNWSLRRIDINPINHPMAGPRGLALRPRANRLYVLNRLDNSVTVINAATEAFITTFSLRHDPTPADVRQGQQFLYSAKLSGNGFVSCASCHIDARTDGLPWDLGTPAVTPEEIPPLLLDGLNLNLTEFPADKEFMVTQSLQGLLNFEVEPESQDLFTNAPYHWRGDRADFTKFNPAFVELLGRDQELTPQQMKEYETFINSVHYPSNPKQPVERVYTGALGTVDDISEPSEPQGSRRGLKLFHIASSDGRSCVHCHALPVGSNTRITEELGQPAAHISLASVLTPLETAALRGLFQREARLDRDGLSDHNNQPITGLAGLTHTGLILPAQPDPDNPNDPLPSSGPDINQVATINAFNRLFFAGSFGYCGMPGAFCNNIKDVNQFVHHMDWGVAPAVGIPVTIDLGNKDQSGTTDALDIGENQARLTNAGLVVQGWIDGVKRGFWYDLTSAQPTYREEPGGGTFSRAALLALIDDSNDLLVAMGAALGSERRMAHPDGQPMPLGGPDPSELELLSMVPNVANSDVPLLTFFWADPFPSSPEANEHGGAFSHTVRLFQHGLIQNSGPSGAFGAALRHEPPRRFRVKGDHIRHGARLEIWTHQDDGNEAGLETPLPPNTSIPYDNPEQVVLRRIVLPIHPRHDPETGETTWETAAEMQNLFYLRMMLGGEFAPGVEEAFNDQDFLVPEPPPVQMFEPETWNWHWVRVVNADGTDGDAGWQRLTIQ